MSRRHYRRLARAYLPVLVLVVSALPPAKPENAFSRRRPDASVTTAELNRVDFRADSTLVLIPVAVTDVKGRVVTDLKRENFQIFEEKNEQRLAYFSAEDAPLSICLVLDFSHSMAGKFSWLREAVAQFLRTANPNDEFCLVEFRDRAELTMNFTAAPEEIQNRVALAQPNGSTALLDAIYLGLRQLKKARNPRKALLIVSDGGDNSSRFCARDVENLARESDAEIYAIGIMDLTAANRGEFEKAAGSSLLDEISEEGGGRYYEIDNPRELPRVAEKIGLELRHQYVLGYTSSNREHDGRYRRVHLKILRSPGRPRFLTSWRRGYYAPVD